MKTFALSAYMQTPQNDLFAYYSNIGKKKQLKDWKYKNLYPTRFLM
jgi:hypothetical protein